MQSTRFLYSKWLSSCCSHRALLVRSRDGGFVSQNCLKCGEPSYVNERALPDLACDHCQTHLSIERLDGQNYFYVCHKCEHSWKLADIVPHWSELFKYAGVLIVICREKDTRMATECPR
jgi:hypothetical protein